MVTALAKTKMRQKVISADQRGSLSQREVARAVREGNAFQHAPLISPRNQTAQHNKTTLSPPPKTTAARHLAVPSGEVCDLGYPPIFDLRRINPAAGVSRPEVATRQRSPPAWYTKTGDAGNLAWRDCIRRDAICPETRFRQMASRLIHPTDNPRRLTRKDHQNVRKRRGAPQGLGIGV